MAELAWEVARYLPSLRRYARAITGDPARGDASVRDCLKRLLPQAPMLAAQDVRLHLYRTLHGIWTSEPSALLRHHGVPSFIENHTIVAARVGELSPAKRQILVLTVLEGFALTEAAEVMGLTLTAAGKLLQQAKHELRSQRASRILIIEDEPIIALDIAATVQQSGHTVVGIASTHHEAVQAAHSEAPELILADIQLADDSSGLAAVQEIFRTRRVPVVFITAFPERLLTGARVEPTLLLTKPFDAETLRVSISQALTAAAGAPALLQ